VQSPNVCTTCRTALCVALQAVPPCIPGWLTRPQQTTASAQPCVLAAQLHSSVINPASWMLLLQLDVYSPHGSVCGAADSAAMHGRLRDHKCLWYEACAAITAAATNSTAAALHQTTRRGLCRLKPAPPSLAVAPHSTGSRDENVKVRSVSINSVNTKHPT
jgi:hypothetical protein